MDETERRDGPPAKRIRVFHVDDHPVVSQALKYAMAEEPDMELCGSARTTREAQKAIRTLRPDVVVVDISIPGVSGLELIRTLRQDVRPPCRVLVFSMCDESLYAERALRAGARGYVMKTEPTGVLLQAIRKVADGQIYVSDRMTTRLLGKALGEAHENNDPVADSVASRLTERELEVFRLIGQGYTVRGAAQELGLSAKTVESHCGSIKKKLGFGNAVQLQQRAALWVNDPPA